MTAPLQMNVADMAPSPVLEAAVRKRLAGLEKIFPRISSYRVTIETARHHQHGGRFSFKLDVRMPGMEIVVTRDHHEDLHVAMREAIAAARRQLREYAARLRDTDKSSGAKGGSLESGKGLGILER